MVTRSTLTLGQCGVEFAGGDRQVARGGDFPSWNLTEFQ